jgi:hypothetical protein
VGAGQKTITEMLADFLREAAVLCAVFIPMDRVISKGEPFTREWLWITVGTSALLLVSGITLERRRGGAA